jgi:hypothetical protein
MIDCSGRFPERRGGFRATLKKGRGFARTLTMSLEKSRRCPRAGKFVTGSGWREKSDSEALGFRGLIFRVPAFSGPGKSSAAVLIFTRIHKGATPGGRRASRRDLVGHRVLRLVGWRPRPSLPSRGSSRGQSLKIPGIPSRIVRIRGQSSQGFLPSDDPGSLSPL